MRRTKGWWLAALVMAAPLGCSTTSTKQNKTVDTARADQPPPFVPPPGYVVEPRPEPLP